MKKRLLVLASSLPELTYVSRSKSTIWVLGSTLIAKGHKISEGKPIDPKLHYKIEPEKKIVNHYKKLKQAHKKKGAKGIQEYMDEVQRIALYNIRKEKDAKTEEE